MSGSSIVTWFPDISVINRRGESERLIWGADGSDIWLSDLEPFMTKFFHVETNSYSNSLFVF